MSRNSPFIDRALEAFLFGALDGRGDAFTDIPKEVFKEKMNVDFITLPNKAIIGKSELAVICCESGKKDRLILLIADTTYQRISYRRDLRPNDLFKAFGDCMQDVT